MKARQEKPKKLYEVQEKHAEVLATALRNFRSALDASATGTGKTVVAAKLAADNGLPTLVVCPKSSITMWERELVSQGCKKFEVVNYEKLRTGKTWSGFWTDAYHKIWRWNFPSHEYFIIWDEAQKAKGMNTQNARMLWSAKPYYNLLLSATAAENPTDMKALGTILGLFNMRNFWFWAKQHGCRPGYFGGLEFSGKDEDLDKIHKAIYPMHGSRLSLADMADHFTETQIITTPVDFGTELKKLYDEMEYELAELKGKQSYDPANALTIRLRARQQAELLKVPTVLEMTEDFLTEGRSVVIFVNFTQTLEALRERLSLSSAYRIGIISGAYVKNRQQYIDDFAADTIPIMLCNIEAGGVSVNLHDQTGKHPRVSIISPSDKAMDVLQCIGRIHRAGGKTPSQQHVLFAAGTIEEEVEKNCRDKIRNILTLNEGLDILNQCNEITSANTYEKLRFEKDKKLA
jgi:Mimiviridae putative ATP-dependent RNA helicase